MPESEYWGRKALADQRFILDGRILKLKESVGLLNQVIESLERDRHEIQDQINDLDVEEVEDESRS